MMLSFFTSRLGGWAVGAVACLVLALLWQVEKSAHKDTLRFLDAETRRANVATETARLNNEKVREIQELLETRIRRDKNREAEHNRILAEMNAEIAAMQKMKEKFHEYTNKKPAVAARAFRRDANRLFRELAKTTCRTDCEDGNSSNPD